MGKTTIMYYIYINIVLKALENFFEFSIPGNNSRTGTENGFMITVRTE